MTLLPEVVILTMFLRKDGSNKRGELCIAIDPLELLNLCTLLNLRLED